MSVRPPNESSASGARELYELKQKAMVYYQENGVPQKMEEILNSMFYDQPNDVHGHIANFFDEFSKTPTVTRLNAHEVLDSKGQPTIQTEVYCIIRNKEKLVATGVASSENREPDHATQEDRDLEEAERQSFVDRALELIKGSLGEVIMGLDPTLQQEADARLENVMAKMQAEEEERVANELAEKGDAEQQADNASRPASVASAKKGNKSAKGKAAKGGAAAVVIIPDEPREKMLCGCSAVSAVSQAVCVAGAHMARLPLYKHLAHLKYNNSQVPSELCLPLPMVTILAGGRAFPGKSNCVKEFMVIPRPGLTFREGMKQVTNIYNTVAKNLTAKGGVTARCVSDTGALCPSMDKLEVGLDLLQEAMTGLGLTPGEDVHIALHCAGQEVFDYEKGKYELVAGQQKSAEDLVEFWAEILGRYPSIIALIDPVRKQEKESWMKLCEKVSEKCFVIGDYVYHRPGLLKNEALPEDFKTSGIVLRHEQMNSVSDVLEVATKMEGANNVVVLSTGIGETTDSFLADLAVGSQARFLKLGAPCRGERVAKLNRLIQIEAELKGENLLGSHGAHNFPRIDPPPPPPEDGEDGAQASEKPDSPTKKK